MRSLIENVKEMLLHVPSCFVVTELETGRKTVSANPEDFGNYPAIKSLMEKRKSGVVHEDKTYFVETVQNKKKLYIFGAGTVAVPLCQFASMCGFEVTVIDDREEFANMRRFPSAHQVICQPIEDVFNTIKFMDHSFYVLVTRGHLQDEYCLRQVLEYKTDYIGMIGSKRKVELVKEHMLKDGYEKSVFERIHAPIGLAIHSVTPEEIAISITAEMIQIKNSLQYAESDAQIWKNIDENCVMMATILEDYGSTPRGCGSKMLIYKDGSIKGSIGGGRLEYEVLQQAENGFDGLLMVMEFNLSNADAAKYGMICGGSAKVLIEKII